MGPVRDVPMGADIKTKSGDSIYEYWESIQVSSLPKGITPIFCDFLGANEENTRKGRSSLARHVIKKECTNLHEVKEWDDDDWKINNVKSGVTRLTWEWVGEVTGSNKSKKAKRKEEEKKEKEKAKSKKKKKSRSSSRA